MKTYIFPVAFEEAENAWHVCVPELESRGAATWGKTRDEALHNIHEVMQMIVEEMIEDGDPIPACVQIVDHTAVAVCV